MTRCTHIERMPLLHLGREIGSASVAQCEHDALPGMVCCAWHATPDAVTMLVESLVRRIEDLEGRGES